MQSTILEQFLTHVEQRLYETTKDQHPKSLYDPVTYTYKLGGKRVRPQLTAIGAGLANGDISKAVPAACAVEMLHNFTLIHDDIMDEAVTRRGEDAVHIKWSASTAILSGDVLFGLSAKELQAYAHDESITKAQLTAIYDAFHWGVQTVCEGQARDMDFEERQDVSLKEYLQMIEQKTAALLSVSLRLGGITANASEERLKELHELGITVGIAFQIQDDFLDVYGNPETFGKRKAGDLYEAKKTWLTIHALEQLPHDDANELSTILHKPERSSIDIDRIYQLFDKIELKKQVREYITSYYEKAESLLTSFPDSEYKEHFKSLLAKLTDRNQ